MGQSAITFESVCKKFGGAGYYAVDHLSFDVTEGEFITILGTSGCGKTTLLKMINRLYEPDDGRILLFGEDIRAQDPVALRRRIGYVIQQIGLFPHMTVAENIATVPRLLQWDAARIDARVRELLEMVGLDPAELGGRFPVQLSGGQQQRVGLARALAVNPKVMLMDEPFGAVDAITRTGLQQELKALHGQLHQTFLLVTHDINEAFLLGNRVLIMDSGRLCQFDTPKAIARDPRDGFVSNLIASARSQEALWEALK